MSTYVAVFALVLAYVALVAAYCALRTLARLRRATTVLARGSRSERGRETLMEATTRHAELTASALEEIAELRTQLDSLGAPAPAADPEHEQGALRNVALVRYDAFAGGSGHLSFSLALLDDGGDGVTISAIAGNADTRVYAKGIRGGKGEHELSPEEQQAVSSALQRPRGVLHRRAS